MDSSFKKPRLRFWKYNPDTKTLYFVSDTNKGKMQYPIGARNFDGYSKSQIAAELRSRLSRYGVIRDDQLNKAILSIGDTVMEHSDIIDVTAFNSSSVPSENCSYFIVNSDYLEHHGILGMHWGVRRFQKDLPNSVELEKETKQSAIIPELDDFLEHHGVKGMRWGHITEDLDRVNRIGRRINRSTQQHSGYYNPNVGSSSSNRQSGSDKSGTHYSSQNMREQHINNKSNHSSNDGSSVILPAGVKDKQYESKFKFPGQGKGGEDGLTYEFSSKDGHDNYKFEYPASEIKKYKDVSSAAYGIPVAVIEQAKKQDVFLTQGMFKAICYDMKQGLTMLQNFWFDEDK